MKMFLYFLTFFPLSAIARAGTSSGEGGGLIFGLIAVAIGFLACLVVGEKIVGKGENFSYTFFVGFVVIAIIISLLGVVFDW